ncbi:MAG: glycoside hydrolase family 2 TIM barrel-domain containing protein [Lachnospiraceae bacterium]
MAEESWEVRSVRKKNQWFFETSCDTAGKEAVSVTVTDPSGNELAQGQAPDGSGTVSTEVRDAKLWSPQTPVLYTVRIGTPEGGSVTVRTGLREIEKKENRVYWNRRPVKLMGLVYREPKMPAGESEETHRELLRHDLTLFKEAGVNYLRAARQPFSESLLTLCDEMGFFVEQTLGWEDYGDKRLGLQNAPALRTRYTERARSVVTAGRNHPCILLWLVGANCVWGDNFRAAAETVRGLDPVRLVNFHLPMTIPENEQLPDVWSVWFNSWNLPMDRCYDQMVVFHTPGADNEIGYQLGEAQELNLPVLHDAMAPVPYHNLDEIDRDPGVHRFWGESIQRFAAAIRQTDGALGGAVFAALDDPEYGCAGVLDQNHCPKPEYEELKRAFVTDTFSLTRTGSLTIAENHLIHAEFSSATGQFVKIAVRRGETYIPVILGGPVLHTGRFGTGSWRAETAGADRIDREVVFRTKQCSQRGVTAVFEIHLREDGVIDTRGTIEDFGRPLPHSVKAGIGLDPGGLDEFGISWLIAQGYHKVAWLSGDPADSFRIHTADSEKDPSVFAAQKFSLFGAELLGTENQPPLRVLSDGTRSIRLEKTPDPVCVIDDRSRSSRIASIEWKGSWYRVEDQAGLVNSTETLSDENGAVCRVSFTGTGITIYGTSDRNRGLCDVTVDGRKIVSEFDEHTPTAYFESMSRGYEKRYHQRIAGIHGLPMGKHVMELTVLGKHIPPSQGNWISVDSFEIDHPEHPERLLVHVNEAVNYPRLVYGNYTRPVLPGRGSKVRSFFKLSTEDEPQESGWTKS